MTTTKTALVLVQSNVHEDPRVRRQIGWLARAGWIVDTVGYGSHPDAVVRDHFALSEPPKWAITSFGTLVLYVLLPFRVAFAVLTESRIPGEAVDRVRSGKYELFVFNDIQLVPWVKNRRTFGPAARKARFHIDVHEYFVPRLQRDTLWRRVTGRYYAWVRRSIADTIFDTRSTVASGIAELYADELGIEVPVVVRNSPPFVAQAPSEVRQGRIDLVHHGVANWARGLREIVDATALLDDRFRVTFMLAGSREVIAELARYAQDLGERVRILPPAPMEELSRAVNQYDLEVMFYRPATRNLEFALPNKLFEAVQGRLGLVVGRSPMMVEIIDRHANGVVVDGWTPQDLARTLNALDESAVRGLKAASDRAASELSSEKEGALFVRTVTGAT